jgi:hypothetical protein
VELAVRDHVEHVDVAVGFPHSDRSLLYLNGVNNSITVPNRADAAKL